MLHQSVKQALNQVVSILETLESCDAFNSKAIYCELNIGNHIRHINDHFCAVKKGCKSGIIDYNHRNRGSETETNLQFGLKTIKTWHDWIDQIDIDSTDQSVKIISEINTIQTMSLQFDSTIARELLYLINHTTHHVAHIGLIAKNHGINISDTAGMAPCTMTYLRSIKKPKP
ncbi:MAG: hypothetical protein AB8B80_13485 [Marinicellaceae bacterium]